MNAEICEFEEATAAALASGAWGIELRRHLDVCSVCAELEVVWRSLAQAKTDQAGAPLPAPGLIWWRSQLVARREQAERAVAAIALMQKLAIAVAFVAGVPLVWLCRPSVWLILLCSSMFLGTGAVLYGWARGRI
jgi:hypothetical protein